MKKRLIHMLGVLVFAFTAGGAQAIPLSDLLAGETITAGDKVFDEWRVINEDYSDVALTVDASNIEVTALDDGGMDPGPGLSFSVLNGALDVTGDGIFAYIDYMFGFRVTAASGLLIKDNSLNITSAGLLNITDNLGVYIQELVGTAPGLVEDFFSADLAIKEVEFSILVDPLAGDVNITNLSDSAAFAPHNSIYVSKNIFVWATDVGETASLTGFSQRFSQIPEPASVLLLGVGLAGLMFRRHRDSSAITA